MVSMSGKLKMDTPKADKKALYTYKKITFSSNCEILVMRANHKILTSRFDIIVEPVRIQQSSRYVEKRILFLNLRIDTEWDAKYVCISSFFLYKNLARVLWVEVAPEEHTIQSVCLLYSYYIGNDDDLIWKYGYFGFVS